jgi:hypothetical protein
MKTLSIGDIHGRDAWMFLTHGSPYEFNHWRTLVEEGVPADSDFHKEIPYYDYDKIIFIGDYVDSFTISNAVMTYNLEQIIWFKKQLPDKVVLLLGNHDIQYILENQYCSGFRPEMKYQFGKLFRDNEELFQLAFQVGDNIWSHAGITSGWYQSFKKDFFDPEYRFAEVVKDELLENIADELNLAWKLRLGTLYTVDSASGGFSSWAGPLWVRPHVLNKHGMDYNQIVGHTPQADIWVNAINEHTTHYFIDCLEWGEINGLTLEI